jgi:methyl coenzyme M reductase beta subunit
MPKKRIVIPAHVTPRAKVEFERATARYGMTRIVAGTRMVEWFARQPDVVRAAVIGGYPKEVDAELARVIVHRLADQFGNPPPA